ncbi:uncharacterized protein LOC131956571 [Physella acuta]|uniref:uncharacterized protein LOC131956571 n=1 Tax=Physella acuta TaxID=109671 RepID=UPI0027DCBF1E|nr:uncharacterized protein LOC131956571 [Physella acuta]
MGFNTRQTKMKKGNLRHAITQQKYLHANKPKSNKPKFRRTLSQRYKKSRRARKKKSGNISSDGYSSMSDTSLILSTSSNLFRLVTPQFPTANAPLGCSETTILAICSDYSSMQSSILQDHRTSSDNCEQTEGETSSLCVESEDSSPFKAHNYQLNFYEQRVIKNTELAKILSELNPPEPYETEHKSLNWEEESSLVNHLRNPEEVQDSQTQAVLTPNLTSSRKRSISSSHELSEGYMSCPSTQDSQRAGLLEQREKTSLCLTHLLETLNNTSDLHDIDNSEETQLKGYLSDESAEQNLAEEDTAPAAAQAASSFAEYLNNGTRFVPSTETCAALESRNDPSMLELYISGATAELCDQSLDLTDISESRLAGSHIEQPEFSTPQLIQPGSARNELQTNFVPQALVVHEIYQNVSDVAIDLTQADANFFLVQELLPSDIGVALETDIDVHDTCIDIRQARAQRRSQ